MRITLETTEYEKEFATKCVIEKPRDDMNIEDMEIMIREILNGFGFYVRAVSIESMG